MLALRSAEMTLEDVFLKITMGEGLVIPESKKTDSDDNADEKGEEA